MGYYPRTEEDRYQSKKENLVIHSSDRETARLAREKINETIQNNSKRSYQCRDQNIAEQVAYEMTKNSDKTYVARGNEIVEAVPDPNINKFQEEMNKNYNQFTGDSITDYHSAPIGTYSNIEVLSNQDGVSNQNVVEEIYRHEDEKISMRIRMRVDCSGHYDNYTDKGYEKLTAHIHFDDFQLYDKKKNKWSSKKFDKVFMRPEHFLKIDEDNNISRVEREDIDEEKAKLHQDSLHDIGEIEK